MRIDTQDIAKQQRRRLRGIGRVKMQEEQAEAERQRQYQADRHIAPLHSLAHGPHADPSEHGDGKQPGQRRYAHQHRPCRAGKADMRQRVARETLPAQHQERADRARQHGDDRRRQEGMAHEVEGEERCHGATAAIPNASPARRRPVVSPLTAGMVMTADFRLATVGGHNEDAVPEPCHLDWRAVEP